MKRRIFSLLLAMVMILSTAALAISATETDAGAGTDATTYPVAENVKGLNVTVDGIKSTNEGWSRTPIFQTKYKVSDPSKIFETIPGFTEPDENGSQEAIVEDENPSSLYISTDGEYVYFFYETTHSDFINGHNDPNASGGSWINAKKWDGGSAYSAANLQIFFAPVGVDLESTNTSDHEGFRLQLRTFTDDSYANNVVETALTTGNQTYVWDHKMGDDNKAENGGAWDASQPNWSGRYFVGCLDNGKNAGVEGVTYGNYSQDILDKTQIAMHVEGEPSKYTKLTVEIAFPISEELSEQLQTGTADYRIATYEQSHRFSEAEVKRGSAVTEVPQNAGYVLSERTLSEADEEENDIKANWCFTKNCGVTFTLPQAVEVERAAIAEYIGNKYVRVDGIMGEYEGWSESALFETSVYASDCKMNDNTVIQEDTSPTKIRISSDGRKVYFFVEITHEDTLRAVWRDCNPEVVPGEDGKDTATDWQSAALVFHFYPDSETPRSELGADNGQFFTLGLATYHTSGLADSKFDENGTYVWDMNVEQGAVTGRSDDFLWRFLWGSQSSNNYSKQFCLERGVELAAHLDKDAEGKRTKLCVEFAFPLADEVVEQMKEGDVSYKFTYWERNNFYRDLTEENPTDIVNRDAGFFLDDTPVDTRVKNDTDDPGKAVVLKQNTDTTYDDFMEWLGEYKESAEYDNLKNLVVNFLGDDYFLGGNIQNEYKWTTMIDEIYNWNITNYVEKGIMASTYDDLQVFPLCSLYRSMSANTPNVVLVSGGLNDYLNGAPIGTIDDTDTDTYMGALKALIDGLREKYRDACIVFTTVYNFEGSIEGSTLTSADYAAALKEVCEYKKVYCLDLYDAETYGIDMSSADFRAEYGQAADDTVNLNLEGNKLLLATYEKFVSEALTDWAANKDTMLAAWEATLNTGNNGGGNNGGNTGNNGGNTDSGNTDNKPTETTPAPAPAEPEKKGCKGVIGVGSALAVLAIVSCAGAVCFKKHD